MSVYNKRGILLLPKVIVLNPKDGSKLLEDWLENHGFLVERGLGSMPTAFRAVYDLSFGVELKK